MPVPPFPHLLRVGGCAARTAVFWTLKSPVQVCFVNLPPTHTEAGQHLGLACGTRGVFVRAAVVPALWPFSEGSRACHRAAGPLGGHGFPAQNQHSWGKDWLKNP